MATVIKGRVVSATKHWRDRVRTRFSATDDEFIDLFSEMVARAILTPTDEVFVRKEVHRTTEFGADRYTIICPQTGKLIVVIASVRKAEIALITAYAPKATTKTHRRPARYEDYIRLFGKAPQHMIDERMAS